MPVDKYTRAGMLFYHVCGLLGRLPDCTSLIAISLASRHSFLLTVTEAGLRVASPSNSITQKEKPMSGSKISLSPLLPVLILID
ncbi:hypothetical protein RDI58_026940 [Solanum bulbocastanum]|uniref:Uncharacterized protein n=1 Tax=Solanum bulbocastanum TaxID=147425 RepID=A0AAN8SXV1_SOLBU